MSAPNRSGFQIGELYFPTVVRVKTHIDQILARYNGPGQPLKGVDDAFVRALLQRHRHYATKIGSGIAWIWVQRNFNSLHPEAARFVIRHTDGSMSDVAWRRCLEPTNALREVAHVCRSLVREQINTFRRDHFRGVCNTCGETITDCHVDHAPPDTFDSLVRKWLHVMRLSADDVVILGARGYEQPSYFEDEILAPEWVEYHAINARLRCVCRRCNLSTLRKASPGNAATDGT